MSRRLAFVLLVVAATGCKHEHSAPSPAVTGLAAVPATAEVVIVADVPRVAASPLVERAADQLLLRDADLAARWQQLHDHCKIDVDHVRHVVLAMGPHAANHPGTGPVLMVATGSLVETQLTACVRALVGQGGGTLTAKPVGNRTLYEAKDGNRTMFFAFSRADTVVLGTSEAFVTEAIGTGKKALDNPELARWIGLADQKAPLWAVGRVDPRVRQGLIRVTGGKLSAGIEAMTVAMDPSAGLELDVGAVMANEADAKTLESFGKTQLGMLAMAAQARSLGTVIDKIHFSADGNVVRLGASLTLDDVNRVLSALDGGGSSEQDASPAPGSGSAVGP